MAVLPPPNKSQLSSGGESGKEFPPIPAGTYTAEVVRWEDRAIDKNRPNLPDFLKRFDSEINFGVKIVGGEHDGRWLWNNFVVDPQGHKFWRNIKAFLGLTEDDEIESDTDTGDTEFWLGRKVVVGVDQKFRDGKVYNNIVQISPVPKNTQVGAGYEDASEVF